MILVDDHLALLAITGRLPELGGNHGPVITTWSFQFRLARALADTAHTGALSRRLTDPAAAVRRVLQPPGDRLIVIDPRSCATEAVRVAIDHRCNLLLSEIVAAANTHHASVRITAANVGKSWLRIFESEGIDFKPVEL